MSKTQKNLMQGLGMLAALQDADGAGYLGHEESVGVQRFKIDFGGFCAGLAAEYLRDRDPYSAKQKLRADFRSIEMETPTKQFSEDESGLIESFIQNIEISIDYAANRSEWRRTFDLWMFRTPGVVKILLVSAALLGIALIVGRMRAT